MRVAISSSLRAWMSSAADFSLVLAKGAAFSGPRRHGAIKAAQSPGTASDYLPCSLPDSATWMCLSASRLQVEGCTSSALSLPLLLVDVLFKLGGMARVY